MADGSTVNPSKVVSGEDDEVVSPRRSARAPKRKNVFDSPPLKKRVARGRGARAFIDDEAEEMSVSEEENEVEEIIDDGNEDEGSSGNESDNDNDVSPNGFTVSQDEKTGRTVHSKAVGAIGDVFFKVYEGNDGYICLERYYNGKTCMSRVVIPREGVEELYRKIRMVADTLNRVRRGEENLDDFRVDLDTSDKFSLLVSKRFKDIIHVRDFNKLKGVGHFKFKGEDADEFVSLVQNEIVQILHYLSSIEQYQV